MAALGKDAIKALESATEKHEHNLVIEFVTDRILNYVGVLVALLASLAKIGQLTSERLVFRGKGKLALQSMTYNVFC